MLPLLPLQATELRQRCTSVRQLIALALVGCFALATLAHNGTKRVAFSGFQLVIPQAPGILGSAAERHTPTVVRRLQSQGVPSSVTDAVNHEQEQILPQTGSSGSVIAPAVIATTTSFVVLLFYLMGRGTAQPNMAEGNTEQVPAEDLTVALPSRRGMLTAAAALALTPAVPGRASASNFRSRTVGYSITHTEDEWQALLTPYQYFILRQGGTEPPFSSPLLKEKRAGSFCCAACNNVLFRSEKKFDSGTGWPSFAAGEPGVEIEQVSAAMRMLAGAELRCRNCGGHLGDVFTDGFLFVGTPAALTGERYCIDGAALVFLPDNGSSPVVGDPGTIAPIRL